MDPFNTQSLDIDIEDAKSKKKTVNVKMDSIMSLMKEVELREKDARKAKQEVDDCTLDIMAEINDLILEQQRVKEANEKRAREVNAMKANLATEINTLSYCLSGVLTQGDGCLATIDEMHKSLEKRLTSAIKQKEEADEEKLLKEATLAYQRSQMAKLVEESKKLEQQATENIKLQDLITDRDHVVNMLQGEISYICQDVNRLKYELGDYQKTSEILDNKDCLRQIKPGKLPRQNCESYKIVKPYANYPDFIREMAMDLLDEDTQAINEPTYVHAYQNSQMEESVEESKTREQEKAFCNLKEFITNFGHSVNKSREEMTWKCQDVNLLKQKLDDSKDENIVFGTEDYLMPIIQETIPMQDWQNNSLMEKNGYRTKEEKEKKKIIKSRMINSKKKVMKKWILEQIKEAYADHLGQITEAYTDHDDNHNDVDVVTPFHT